MPASFFYLFVWFLSFMFEAFLRYLVTWAVSLSAGMKLWDTEWEGCVGLCVCMNEDVHTLWTSRPPCRVQAGSKLLVGDLWTPGPRGHLWWPFGFTEESPSFLPAGGVKIHVCFWDSEPQSSAHSHPLNCPPSAVPDSAWSRASSDPELLKSCSPHNIHCAATV